MKKGSRILILFGAAALTFGTLVATVGHGHFRFNRHCAKQENCQTYHQKFGHCAGFDEKQNKTQIQDSLKTK